MAYQQNPDGTVTVIDDTGRMAPFTIPAAFAPPPASIAGPAGQPFAPAPQLPEAPTPAPIVDPWAAESINWDAAIRPPPARTDYMNAPLPAPPAPLPTQVTPESGDYGLFMNPGVTPEPRLSASPDAHAQAPVRQGTTEILNPAPQTLSDALNPVTTDWAPTPSMMTLTPHAQPGEAAPSGLGGETVNLPAGARYAGPRSIRAEGLGSSSSGGRQLVTGTMEGEGGPAPSRGFEPASILGDSGGGSTLGGQILGAAVRREAEAAAAKAGQYSPGRPARDVPTQFSLKEGIPYTQAEMDAMVETRRSQAINAVQSGESQAQRILIAALVQQEQAEEARRELARLKESQAVRDRIVSDRTKNLDERIKQVRERALTNPVDTYWAKKGGFGTLMTKIGIALSEGGATLAGGTSTAYQQVKDEIDAEVAFQGRQLQDEQADIENQRGIVAELRAQGLSPVEAVTAGRALMLEAASSEMKAQALMQGSDQAYRAGIDAASKLSADTQDELLKYKAAATNEVVRHFKHEQARAGGRGKPFNAYTFAIMKTKELNAAGMKTTAAEVFESMLPQGEFKQPKTPYNRAQVSLFKMARETSVDIPADFQKQFPGLPPVMYAARTEEAKSTDKSLKALAHFKSNTERLLEIVKNSANWESLPGSPAHAEIKILRGIQAGLLKDALIKEALTAGELDRVWEPLLAGEADRVFTFEANTVRRLETLTTQANELARREIYGLDTSPFSQDSGGSILTTLPEGATKLPRR